VLVRFTQTEHQTLSAVKGRVLTDN
jgi:hypothetical protein